MESLKELLLLFFYELCQNTRDSGTRRVPVVRGSVNNQFGLIGFVLTAKSIARFKQMEDKNFAEKYLIGTLTSFLIVLITVLILKGLL